MDFPYRPSKKTKQERRAAAIEDFKAKAMLVGFSGAAVAAVGALFYGVISYGTAELSSPAPARRAVLDAGYTNPIHTGPAGWRECRTGGRRENRYYADQFQAVSPNGRQVNLVVCRVEGTSISTVHNQTLRPRGF